MQRADHVVAHKSVWATCVNAGNGSVRIHRHGFLVEDSSEMAERNGLKDVKAEKIERGQIPAIAAARRLFPRSAGG